MFKHLSDDSDEPTIPPSRRTFADKILWARALGFDLVQHKLRQSQHCRGAFACYSAIAESTVSNVLCDVRVMTGADDGGTDRAEVPRQRRI